MYRVDDPTNAAALPTPAAQGTPGFYVDGVAGVLASTIVRADHMNAMQEELIAMVVAFGETPTKGQNAQIAAGITGLLTELAQHAASIAANATNIANEIARAKTAEALKAPLASPAFTGAPTAPSPAAADNSAALAVTNWVLGRLIDGGVNPRSLATNGYLTLPGGLIAQWGAAVTPSNGNMFIAFPEPFPNACVAALACEGNASGWGGNEPTVYGINNTPSKSSMNVIGMKWSGSGWVQEGSLAFFWIALGY